MTNILKYKGNIFFYNKEQDNYDYVLIMKDVLLLFTFKKKTLETLVEIFYFYSHMNQYGWQYTYIQYHIGVYDIRENVFDQNN